jgi:hypothetical protein
MDKFFVGLIIGFVFSMSISIYTVQYAKEQSYKYGQIQALSGIVRVHQVTNEVGEVKWRMR